MILCRIKAATVLDKSDPFSMIWTDNWIISVLIRKLIISGTCDLTKTPIIPRVVSLKSSADLLVEFEFKKG
jgi:hypothetical protein